MKFKEFMKKAQDPQTAEEWFYLLTHIPLRDQPVSPEIAAKLKVLARKAAAVSEHHSEMHNEEFWTYYGIHGHNMEITHYKATDTWSVYSTRGHH